MTLLEAVKGGHRVLIQFVDVERNSQWGITFDKPSDLAHFLTPMVGELVDTGEPNPEKPFKYYKAIFVSENEPEKKPEHEPEPELIGKA